MPDFCCCQNEKVNDAMARNLINKYIWIIDTIQRYGRITREELNRLWVKSSLSDGEPLARRTFYNYRQGIEDTFNMTVECDPATFEYYIDTSGSEQDDRLRNWLLDAASMSGMLSDSRDVSDRIVLEDVPSARVNLPVVIQAMKEACRINFSYRAYNRINTKRNITVEPYFVRIFKQLWYVVGFNTKDGMIKTYSLDRMSDVVIRNEHFDVPKGFNAADYFKDCFGIMQSKGEPKNVTLKVTSNQAKYFRALPLHHSQSEEIHDNYSLFHYRLLITYDFIQEILSHGSQVEVVAPAELKAMVVNELHAALDNYNS